MVMCKYIFMAYIDSTMETLMLGVNRLRAATSSGSGFLFTERAGETMNH